MIKKKVWFAAILCCALLFPTLSAGANTEQSKKNWNPAESYGLLLAAGICEYDTAFDATDAVSAEVYNQIMRAWFGTEATESGTIRNCDFVSAVALQIQSESNAWFALTQLKDYGLIPKETRSDYKKLCAAGIPISTDGYANPHAVLTYETMLGILSGCKQQFLDNTMLNCERCQIIEATLKSDTRIFKTVCDGKPKEFKLGKKDSFYIQKLGKVAPYNFEIKPGDIADIYTDSKGKILFVSLLSPDGTAKLAENETLLRAKLYLCDTYNEQVILQSEATGENSRTTYTAYSYTGETLFYANKILKTPEEINGYYLDRTAYLIMNQETKTIKYINITE